MFDNASASDTDADSATLDLPPDFINLTTFTVTPAMVIAAAKKLKSSLSPGPDGIPSILFCRCATVLAEPLSTIFTRSLDNGVFPEIWKQSFMFPVFKNGDRRNVMNYRGITNLSAASKLFEIIVSDVILSQSKQYISVDQHGFMPGRSVTTNLLSFTNICVTAMEDKAQVDVIYTDLKAAFDRIDHKILLRKLSRLGASNKLASWLSSYLTGRQLRVKIDSSISSTFCNSSGVPQGSNLGPLLFTLFFNDVAAKLGLNCVIIYADDLKIYLVIRSVEDCHRLQALIDQFFDWCIRNKLTVSIPKCSVMTFHRSKHPLLFDYQINGVKLRRVDEVTDLGVVLDPKLTFNGHYTSIISKANRQLGFISKIAKDFTDPYCLKSLYCALVRPILENASVVWTPNDISWTLRIERVQRRFIRLALKHLPWRDPVNLPAYPERCKLIGMDTLEKRRKMQQAIFVAKLMGNEIDSSRLLSMLNFRAIQRPLRQRSMLQSRFHRTTFGYNDPICSMIRSFTLVEDLYDFGETSLRFKHKICQSSLL